ncbi:hypothetical protein ACLOJK_007422 [Asimina triloba]
MRSEQQLEQLLIRTDCCQEDRLVGDRDRLDGWVKFHWGRGSESPYPPQGEEEVMGAGHLMIIAADVVKEEECRRFIRETYNYYGRYLKDVFDGLCIIAETRWSS